EKETAALKALDSGLGVGVTPGSAIISASYESDDPVRAAQVLNAVVDQYLVQRRQVFGGGATPAYAAQREAFENDLATADEAYNAFLASNDIGDFATAKASLAANYQTTYAEALSLRAQLNQASQRLATLEGQLAQQPAEVVLQQDLNVSAQDQILQLRTQREVLLSRYTPEAQPVRDIDQQIADLQAYVATGTTVGPREVRTGPSAIFTEIETARITAAADRDGLAARLAVAERQLNQLRALQAEMTRLESTNANLAGNREVLTTLVRDFQQRESAARADSALVAAGADNVNVIERAEAPTRGSSLKAPLLAAVFLFAAFTALCVGLLRVFMRRGYATPASTGRTLEMPVLAVAPMKAR
ncbi:MAG: chain-length determining protein, partial [Brevundimonas sp.]|nr:chain-length determining protein [Brevundimonas sp.]